MEVKNKIRSFLGKYFDESTVADEDNIFEKGLVDSLFAMQLVTFIEKEFEIGITNDELDLENFKSISAITSLVENKIQ